MLAIETVAVLGSGEAALGAAIVASQSGCALRLHDPAPEALDQAFAGLRFRVDLGIERGVLTRSDRQRILDGVLFTNDLAEAVTGADLIIEAEPEPVGGSGLGRAVDLARATAVLAAPTQASASSLAGSVPHPGRILVVAVDRDTGVTRITAEAAPGTSRHTLEAVQAFLARVDAHRSHAA